MLNNLVDKCHNNLFSSKLALAYLLSRKVTMDDIRRYKIGFTSRVLDNIEETSQETKNFNAWLGVRGSYVSNRILFPIYDELGNIRGVETRGLDKKAALIIRPEYLKAVNGSVNALPESTIRYKKFYLEKSKQLACFFGIPQALKSIWETKYVFITEGIFDCLSAMRIYPNCISTLTANINKNQMAWLRRFTNKIIFLFDNDKKGKESIIKLKKLYSDQFLMYDISLKGDDINEMEMKCGLGDIKKLIDYKMNMFF